MPEHVIGPDCHCGPTLEDDGQLQHHGPPFEDDGRRSAEWTSGYDEAVREYEGIITANESAIVTAMARGASMGAWGAYYQAQDRLEIRLAGATGERHKALLEAWKIVTGLRHEAAKANQQEADHA